MLLISVKVTLQWLMAFGHPVKLLPSSAYLYDPKIIRDAMKNPAVPYTIPYHSGMENLPVNVILVTKNALYFWKITEASFMKVHLISKNFMINRSCVAKYHVCTMQGEPLLMLRAFIFIVISTGEFGPALCSWHVEEWISGVCLFMALENCDNKGTFLSLLLV